MQKFEFILKFSLPALDEEAGHYVGLLAQAGCDDALIGVGLKGNIALDFSRQAASAEEALLSAVRDVKKAIPHSRLIEACPDLVGLTDIAEILGFSRQNIRKLVLNHPSNFPNPVHDGKTAIWHLCTVLNWFEDKRKIKALPEIKAIAEVNMQLNIAKEATYLNSGFQRKSDKYLTRETSV